MERGHGARSQPGGAGLTAAFYSHRHQLTGHYCYKGISGPATSSPISQALCQVCVCVLYGSSAVIVLKLFETVHSM